MGGRNSASHCMFGFRACHPSPCVQKRLDLELYPTCRRTITCSFLALFACPNDCRSRGASCPSSKAERESSREGRWHGWVAGLTVGR